MDLHGIASPYVAAVNPLIPVTLRISAGSATAPDGTRAPAYATPGALTGSIAGDVLTVTAVSQGELFARQTIAGSGVVAGTEIVAQITGAVGGPGTYRISRYYASPVVSGPLTTTLVMMAQVQPITWRDLQQMEGLNLGGVRRKIYMHGASDAVVRVKRKGGDMVVIDSGVDAGTWLVAQVLEQFPDWVCAAVTLQNG